MDTRLDTPPFSGYRHPNSSIAQTREALSWIVDDRRRPLAHILRARIVLLSDERLPALEVARQAGVGRPTVGRWQQRFAEEGLDGLLRDKTRPPGKPATPQDEVQAVLGRTLTDEHRARLRTGRDAPWRACAGSR